MIRMHNIYPCVTKMYIPLYQGVVYSCDQCSYTAKAKKYLKRHYDTKHLGIQVSSDVDPDSECGSGFRMRILNRIQRYKIKGKAEFNQQIFNWQV